MSPRLSPKPSTSATARDVLNAKIVKKSSSIRCTPFHQLPAYPQALEPHDFSFTSGAKAFVPAVFNVRSSQSEPIRPEMIVPEDQSAGRRIPQRGEECFPTGRAQ